MQQIKEEGPIPFNDFMEKCLYYPELGYYTGTKEQIGRSGDFYTSSSITPAFGAMIAKQIAEMWKISGENDFTIVEYGAGTGLLCSDILAYFKNYTRLYDQLHYAIIEKSPVMQERQKRHLKEKVRWYSRFAEIKPVTGCVLSNELLDNFAVHQVVMKHELMEVFVDYKDGFTELLRPAPEILKDYLSALDIALPENFRAEINLEAVRWIKEVAGGLKKGYVITIDYGNISEELYAPRKSNGTLVCYNKNTVNDQPFIHIGQQDITAHVNFSALSYWGSVYGLRDFPLTDQASFLLSLGFKEFLRHTLAHETDLIRKVQKESFITNLLLIDMGSKFKVLIQKKICPIKDCWD